MSTTKHPSLGVSKKTLKPYNLSIFFKPS